jgi:hypothetical protein
MNLDAGSDDAMGDRTEGRVYQHAPPWSNMRAASFCS